MDDFTWYRLEIRGNDYVIDDERTGGTFYGREISHGSLTSTDSPAPLLAVKNATLKAWTSTSAGIFFSYDEAMYVAPLP